MTLRLLLASLLGSVCSGCVVNDQSLTIARFISFDPNNMCTATVSSTMVTSGGILDVGLVAAGATLGGYWAAPVIQNNEISTATSTHAETNNIELTGLDVQLLLSGPLAGALGTGGSHYFVSAAGGLVAPAGGGSNQNIMVAEILPYSLALKMANGLPTGAGLDAAQAVLHMRPVGTQANETIEGGFANFPIQLCNGCLGHLPAPSCPSPPLSSSQVARGGCYPGQDQSITCCTQGGKLLCGAAVPTM